jgi:hypothetical protein
MLVQAVLPQFSISTILFLSVPLLIIIRLKFVGLIFSLITAPLGSPVMVSGEAENVPLPDALPGDTSSHW